VLDALVQLTELHLGGRLVATREVVAVRLLRAGDDRLPGGVDPVRHGALVLHQGLRSEDRRRSRETAGDHAQSAVESRALQQGLLVHARDLVHRALAELAEVHGGAAGEVRRRGARVLAQGLAGSRAGIPAVLEGVEPGLGSRPGVSDGRGAGGELVAQGAGLVGDVSGELQARVLRGVHRTAHHVAATLAAVVGPGGEGVDPVAQRSGPGHAVGRAADDLVIVEGVREDAGLVGGVRRLAGLADGVRRVAGDRRGRRAVLTILAVDTAVRSGAHRVLRALGILGPGLRVLCLADDLGVFRSAGLSGSSALALAL